MKNKEVKIIDGKKIAEEILLDLKNKIAKSNIKPGLAVILVGDDEASKLYVRNKERACHKVGINIHTYLCNQDCCPDISENQIIEIIEFLNNDADINGIIVQLPLPKKFNTQKIIAAIDPKKDADGFHPENIKKILQGQLENFPPLFGAILEAIKSENINLKDKKVVIISNSNILPPVFYKVFEDLHCQPRVIRSDYNNLIKETIKADVLISIIGKPEFIKKEMIKEDAVLIDVGITKIGKEFKGDFDFNSVKKKVSVITPTPGGIGPLTVAMLLKNVYQLAKNK